MILGRDDSWKGRKAIITGGCGFIGSNLARRLVEAEAQVTLVDSLVPEYGGNLYNISDIKGKVALNISDVRDKYSLRYLIKDQDFLFNLAGQTSHMDSMSDPQSDLDINCAAQLSILEVCREVNPDIRVVFASTRQIYGKPDYLPVDEKHPVRPVDVNGINKMAGEWYHVLYNNVYELGACALRLTNTYGPRMRVKDARQTFLGIWIKKILQGKPFEVWEGRQLRDFTYVDDCVDALLLAARSESAQGKIFNLGGAEDPISLDDLAKMLVQANGGGEFQRMSFPTYRRKIDIGDYYSNSDLIRNTLGWIPKVTLKEGLDRTLKYYSKNMQQYL